MARQLGLPVSSRVLHGRAMRRLIAAGVLGVLFSCGKNDPPPVAAHHGANEKTRCSSAGTTVEVEEQPPEVHCSSSEREVTCIGEWAAQCGPDGKREALENCRDRDLVCVPRTCDDKNDCDACRSCHPGDVRCGPDGARERCSDDGSDYEAIESCDTENGQFCNPLSGACEDLCQTAADTHSYIGCEYWAVPTSNSQLELDGESDDGSCQPFSFAVVIANPESVPASVTIDSPGFTPLTLEVEPDGLSTVDLPCAPELKGDPEADERFTVKSLTAAHHIRSNVPVTVYQFNPLEFKAEVDGSDTYSYTNDASLLLPVSSLGDDYLVLTQPTLHQRLLDTLGDTEPVDHASPGFVAIVGVEDEPTAVEITSSAYTLASEDGELPAVGPGDTLEVTLEKGEVLQLLSATPEDCPGEQHDTIAGGDIRYCDVGPEYDLTGTRIHAEGRVSVISGHDCTFLPYYRWACDHLEETMFPLHAWGKEVLLSVSQTAACQDTVPNMARVLAAKDGTRVNFVPEVHDPVTLDAGESVQFEFSEDFRATASNEILVGQFLLGQDYEGRGKAGSFAKGDPSMSLGIPVEQWRTSYTLLTPSTYTENYVNVIARENQVVQLDGALVQGFTPIEGTPMRVARVPLAAGQHRVRSEGTVGLVAYGYAPYTSYMLPGGLDLNELNGPE